MTAAKWTDPSGDTATEKTVRTAATARWVDPFDDKPAKVGEAPCQMTINSIP